MLGARFSRHTRSPAAAAQNPPIAQIRRFTGGFPFSVSIDDPSVCLDAVVGDLTQLTCFAEDAREATLRSMDRVRFGRVLGFGARQAVKTLTTAVDAATAPNPAAKSEDRSANTGQTAARSAPATPANKAAQTAVRTVVQAREVKQGLGRGTRRFREAVWRPFVRLSGVVWLEVTGVFFGIFALLALGYLWKLRGAWHTNGANGSEHRSLMGALIMLALFGYFCVSSFVRARRRERGR